jgi:C_GCAxxG_C_C family probable redox protein
VLLAVSETRGIPSELVPKVASGFCSGIARSGDLCGAVSGGILALGVLMGRSGPAESMDRIYAAVLELRQAFAQTCGSTNCHELIGCDLGTADGQRHFAEQGLRERCGGFVQTATRIVLAIADAEPV